MECAVEISRLFSFVWLTKDTAKLARKGGVCFIIVMVVLRAQVYHIQLRFVESL